MAGAGKAVNKKNLPRECIRKFFLQRHCFVLCKPVDDDEKLAHLDEIPDSEIKPKFLDAATDAIETIMSTAEPFTVEHHNINGSRKSFFLEN